MASFVGKTKEEAPNQPQTFTASPFRFTAKILATKTQNYFAQTKRTETILIQIAFSIGLGSMWRFPYLCHRNGGGEFILMYLLMLLLFGIPLLYMEMIMGQWLRIDSIGIWKQLVPCLGGIGYASILVCILVSLYNSIIISWSLSYLGNSFYHALPWDQCPLATDFNVTDLSCLQTVPHQYFWYHTTLNASSYIEEGIKSLVPNLTLGIFAAWFILFVIIITGLKISMPILILSVFLPYITLLCLLIRGLFLEGAATSLRRMVTTEPSDWPSLDRWYQAGGHVLYSLGLGMGTVINISYKAGDNNYIQVALWTVVVNLVTSLLATSIIFIVLGFWATTSGQACVEKSVLKLTNLIRKGVLPQNVRPPKDILLLPSLDYLKWIEKLPQHLQYEVVHSSPPCSIREQNEKFMQGPGLAFAAFSQAVSLLPGASFWSIVLFLALLITELSALIKILEGIVFSLQNTISTIKKYRLMPPVVICLGGFLGSLVFTSHPGSYIMSLFDDHLIPLILFIIVAFQNTTLAWIYGANRFREEMYSGLGHLLWSFFTFLWCYVTLPGLLALLIICLMGLYESKPRYYIAWNRNMTQEVKQPYMQSTLGWITFLSVLTFLPIPIYPLHQWWYLQDHIVNEPFEKPLSKKMPLVPTKPSQRLNYFLAKPTFMSQERRSEISTKRSSTVRGLDSMWWFHLPSNQQSSSSSRFSIPLISSLTSIFSMRSLSLPSSRQVSPSSNIDNSDRSKENNEENLPKKPVQ
ncbi:orphan sodium- and chloride-dependent neurotransmitter transporter NTT5-like [Molossus nigricans]